MWPSASTKNLLISYNHNGEIGEMTLEYKYDLEQHEEYMNEIDRIISKHTRAVINDFPKLMKTEHKTWTPLLGITFRREDFNHLIK